MSTRIYRRVIDKVKEFYGYESYGPNPNQILVEIRDKNIDQINKVCCFLSWLFTVSLLGFQILNLSKQIEDEEYGIIGFTWGAWILIFVLLCLKRTLIKTVMIINLLTIRNMFPTFSKYMLKLKGTEFEQKQYVLGQTCIASVFLFILVSIDLDEKFRQPFIIMTFIWPTLGNIWLTADEGQGLLEAI